MTCLSSLCVRGGEEGAHHRTRTTLRVKRKDNGSWFSFSASPSPAPPRLTSCRYAFSTPGRLPARLTLSQRGHLLGRAPPSHGSVQRTHRAPRVSRGMLIRRGVPSRCCLRLTQVRLKSATRRTAVLPALHSAGRPIGNPAGRRCGTVQPCLRYRGMGNGRRIDGQTQLAVPRVGHCNMRDNNHAKREKHRLEGEKNFASQLCVVIDTPKKLALCPSKAQRGMLQRGHVRLEPPHARPCHHPPRLSWPSCQAVAGENLPCKIGPTTVARGGGRHIDRGAAVGRRRWMGGGARPDESRGRRKSTAKMMGPTSAACEGGRNVGWRAAVGERRCAAGRIARPCSARGT